MGCVEYSPRYCTSSTSRARSVPGARMHRIWPCGFPGACVTLAQPEPPIMTVGARAGATASAPKNCPLMVTQTPRWRGQLAVLLPDQQPDTHRELRPHEPPDAAADATPTNRGTAGATPALQHRLTRGLAAHR